MKTALVRRSDATGSVAPNKLQWTVSTHLDMVSQMGHHTARGEGVKHSRKRIGIG